MKITWDKKAKAIYIYLVPSDDESKVDYTTRVEENIWVDYQNGKPVGIEILDVEDVPVVEEIST